MENFEISRLPNIVYYNNDHSRSPRCTTAIAKVFNCTYTLPSTWVELTRELELGGTHVAMHASMIQKSGISIATSVAAIRFLTKFTADQQFVKVMIVITPKTDRSVIDEIQSLEGVSIGLDIAYYPVEEAAAGAKAFVDGTVYYPQHIIDALPTKPVRPKSIYFREDYATYITPQMVEKLQNQLDMDVLYCASWQELGNALDKNPHQLIFHIGMLNRLDTTISEIMSMLETKIKLAGLSIPIGVGIEPTTTLSMIKELKQSGVSVIVPAASAFGMDETIIALKALRDRQQYFPAHIIKQLPGNKPQVSKSKNNNIQLTLRQEQVLDLIKNRGASNKVIAKMLKISESTVKLHITAVLKKYGAKNRTQLALFANKEKEHA